MTDRGGETIDLYLSDIANFFQTPEVDPFLGENIEASGMEQLIDTMNARSRFEKPITAIAVHLPQAMISGDLTGRLKAALVSYCGTQVRLAAQKKREVLLEGRTALRIGLVFWAICLALSLLSERIIPYETVARLFSEGFIIAGWVCLWHPAELLLYAWRPHALDMKRHKEIAAMDVRILPREA